MLSTIPLVFLSFFLALLGVGAAPLDSRDVYNPPITTPNAESVWKAGGTYTVTWDVSSLPSDDKLTRPTGTVILGYKTEDSLNLMYMTPLAKGFKLRDAKVEITLPQVISRDNYIIVLMGDSGNTSPLFTIEGDDSSSSVEGSTSRISSIPRTTPASAPLTSIATSTSSFIVPSSTPVTLASSSSSSSIGLPSPTAPSQNTSSAWLTRRVASPAAVCAVGLATLSLLSFF